MKTLPKKEKKVKEERGQDRKVKEEGMTEITEEGRSRRKHYHLKTLPKKERRRRQRSEGIPEQ